MRAGEVGRDGLALFPKIVTGHLGLSIVNRSAAIQPSTESAPT